MELCACCVFAGSPESVQNDGNVILLNLHFYFVFSSDFPDFFPGRVLTFCPSPECSSYSLAALFNAYLCVLLEVRLRPETRQSSPLLAFLTSSHRLFLPYLVSLLSPASAHQKRSNVPFCILISERKYNMLYILWVTESIRNLDCAAPNQSFRLLQFA